MTKLFDKINKNEVALGVFIKGGPHIISTLVRGGFDFVRPDMMFSSIDWKELDHILRASQALDLTVVTRIPSNPWVGGTQQMQVTVDAARAFSLGIPVVQVSVSSAAQVRALVEVAKDWHRSGAGEYPNSNETFVSQNARAKEEALILPALESKTAYDDLDEMFEIEGLRGVFIACTDLSKELGYPFQYDHPEMWKAVDRITQKARDKKMVVFANTGYEYNTPEGLIYRVSKLYQHGVNAVMMQGAEFLLEHFAKRLLVDIRNEAKL